MSTASHDILEKSDGLPEPEKQEVAAEILSRTRKIHLPLRASVGSPRLVNRQHLPDFEKEVAEEPHDARVRR